MRGFCFLLLICILECNLMSASDDALIFTNFIKNGRIEEARNASIVDPNLLLGVQSHSGFFTVDESYNSNLFFWYFPVNNKPINETPWIIWLQGGPGATSLVGLFDEIGPLEYNTNNTLKLRQWSWGKDYSLLFIDNPIGAGYSFTDDERGYARDMDTYGKHLHIAIQQFITIFPELQTAPLFIAGESYSGRYIPALASEIHKHTSNKINLQGLIMGNPVLERENIVDLSSMFYHWGLIDDQGKQSASSLQQAYANAVQKNDYVGARDAWERLLDYLLQLTSMRQIYNILKDDMDFNGFLSFLTSDIGIAIHVGTRNIIFNNPRVKEYLLPDFLVHTRPIVEELLDSYRILIYCGQLDLMSPCAANSVPRRKTWQWKKRTNFMKAIRIPWQHNGTLAGYVKSGGGLTEVLMRGAGHMCPIDKPEETLSMIKYFIEGQPFPNNYDWKGSEKDLPLEISEQTSANGIILTSSVFLNLVLILIFVVMIILWKRKRNRNDVWKYTAVDERIQNNILEIS